MPLPYENATSGERAHNFIDISGQQFGRWSVLSFDVGRKKWLCRCSCGRESLVGGVQLRRGLSSCCKGCANVGRVFKHGQASERNGFTRKYRAWVSMLGRVRDKTSPRARWYAGITVHPAWADFKQFDADVPDPPSEELTLDRIDNSKGYYPGNVRWATIKEQANNRRNSLASGKTVLEHSFDSKILPALEGPSK